MCNGILKRFRLLNCMDAEEERQACVAAAINVAAALNMYCRYFLSHVTRSLSLSSATKMASSFAGFVLLAFSLTL